MPMVRAMRLMNAVEAGTTSGAQLQTLLAAEAGRLSELNVLLQMRGQVRRLAASPVTIGAFASSSTAMSAVVVSPTAMVAISGSQIAASTVTSSSTAVSAISANDQASRIMMLTGTGLSYKNYANVAAVIASSTAMAAVAASSQAVAFIVASSTLMTDVAASSVGMTAMAASSIAMPIIAGSSTAMTIAAASSAAKMAFYNSDIALNAIKARAAAMSAMRAASGYSVFNNNPTQALTAINGPNVAGSYIVLGVSKNSAGAQGLTAINTRRSGTSIAGSVANITNPASTAATDVNLAIPIATTFQSSVNDINQYTWYYGMLRCDV